MKKTINYSCLPKFVFRTTAFPANSNLKDIYNSSMFEEALFLASPDLHGILMNEKDKSFDELPAKLKLSIYKYVLRIKNRCTPFGLFAGCGVGDITDDSKIQIDREKSFKSSSRLDMTYLCALNQYICNTDSLSNEFIYFVNNSLYPIADWAYRYVEVHFVNGERKYVLNDISRTKYLEQILELCHTGAKKQQLVQLLKAYDYDQEESNDFINLLYENQILVTNREPTVTGEHEFLDHILNWISQTSQLPENLLFNLQEVKKQLKDIDKKKPGRDIQYYGTIEEKLKFIPIEFNKKFLFQSDMTVLPIKATLDENLITSVKEGISALNKIGAKKTIPLLEKFKKDFHARYEDEEIPLIEALDFELGLGFSNYLASSIVSNPLIDDIGLGLSRTKTEIVRNETSESFLQEKYYDFLKYKKEEIIITDYDLDSFEEKPNDLPSTFSAMIEVLKLNKDTNSPLINLKIVGGTSAANLLARFCHTYDEIHNIVKEIINIEDRLIDSDQLLAEIVHLPESRMGNILYRPKLRTYELPYITTSAVDEDKTIQISDLLIAVKGGKEIILRSKKLNKQIIPKHTNSHNFSYNSLPIYHFLCLLQLDGLKQNLTFSWTSNLINQDYLPRVRYKNMILSPARWNLTPADLKDIPAPQEKKFDESFRKLRINKGIPDQIYIVVNDNRLFIDFKDPLSTEIFFSSAKKRDIVVEEFLFDPADALIKEGTSVYNNEIILSFYNNKVNRHTL